MKPKTLKGKFGQLTAMKNLLGIDEKPLALEESFKAGTKLKHELRTDMEIKSVLLMELPSSAEGFDVKTQEESQNTDIDLEEILGTDKVLQSISVTW